MSPILSIETLISAMMCLCSSNTSSTSNNFYSSIADNLNHNRQSQTIALVQHSEIMNIKEKLNSLTEKFDEIQRRPEVISMALKGNEERKRQISNPKIRLNASPVIECPRSQNSGGVEEILQLSVPALLEKKLQFNALCVGDGWLVIQQRFDGAVDFFLPWKDYQRGFGLVSGEFFVGLDRLHALTNDRPHELKILLEDFENEQRFAQYQHFVIGNENDGYLLRSLGSYFGNAGDSLTHHLGHKFSTYDNDASTGNCANTYEGAWWFTDCLVSNLNGRYLTGSVSKEQYGKGVSWMTWRGLNYSMKSVRMLIRPRA